ncbi:MAG TPA: hypothetical protein VI916_15190, partial [Acidimicrobiia bacterium]|nr:hypothetical protein [Acidimicrobiia bacterium]
MENWRRSAVAAGHGGAERGADLTETSAPSEHDTWKSLENSEFLRDVPPPRVWRRKITTNSSPGGEAKVERRARGTSRGQAGDTAVAPSPYGTAILPVDHEATNP